MTCALKTRRDFLKKACASVATIATVMALPACSGTKAALKGITKEGNLLTLDLALLPDLTKTNGLLLIENAQVLVIHAKEGYRAFSAICPHEGNLVKAFDGEKMTCPEHGWTYKPDGKNTRPSRRGLKTYPLLQEAETLKITLG